MKFAGLCTFVQFISQWIIPLSDEAQAVDSFAYCFLGPALHQQYMVVLFQGLIPVCEGFNN